MKSPVEINGKIFVPVRQAADRFGYSSDHLTRLAKAKKISAAQLGRSWYVSELSITNYLEDQQAEALVRKQILSKKRQVELGLHAALSTASSNRVKHSEKSGKLASVCACLFFGFLIAAASQIAPSSLTSLASLGWSAPVVPLAVDESGATQAVFSYDDTVLVSNSDRRVEKPVVTPQWVLISP